MGNLLSIPQKSTSSLWWDEYVSGWLCTYQNMLLTYFCQKDELSNKKLIPMKTQALRFLSLLFPSNLLSNITCVLKSSLQFWNNFDDVWYFPDKAFFSLRLSKYVSTSSAWKSRENIKDLTFTSKTFRTNRLPIIQI